ncbi:Leucine-rich repeat-containing protein 51 [Rhizophlyctis rosea]|uniref:Leucine-rich repeat-containing protein 51 n=1 Tax=Rhizophlyctis rosea TaxID=64517 RepID=A0AAD5X5Q8_9FUNG|nr:Leucine-rich repeat-containing protein 51 [Rhizophlyctis rosea]
MPPKVPGKISENWSILPAPPLDFTFKDLSDVGDIINEGFDINPPPGTAITSLRLANNQLTSAANLIPTLTKLIPHPEWIGWIDLSFNKLTNIEDSLLAFPTLKTLYLHANNLTDLSETSKLSLLPTLKTLTLHGNPLESSRSYRHYVIAHLPRLKHLDFCAITKQDRSVARVLEERNRRRAERSEAGDQ